VQFGGLGGGLCFCMDVVYGGFFLLFFFVRQLSFIFFYLFFPGGGVSFCGCWGALVPRRWGVFCFGWGGVGSGWVCGCLVGGSSGGCVCVRFFGGVSPFSGRSVCCRYCLFSRWVGGGSLGVLLGGWGVSVGAFRGGSYFSLGVIGVWGRLYGGLCLVGVFFGCGGGFIFLFVCFSVLGVFGWVVGSLWGGVCFFLFLGGSWCYSLGVFLGRVFRWVGLFCSVFLFLFFFYYSFFRFLWGGVWVSGLVLIFFCLSLGGFFLFLGGGCSGIGGVFRRSCFGVVGV